MTRVVPTASDLRAHLLAPITSSIGVATECAGRGRRAPARARRRGDANVTDLPPPCQSREAVADMQVMLREMERHYGKRPIIDTTVDFYQANLFQRRVDGLSDLGALHQTPSCGEVRVARLAFLAVSIRRPSPGHRRQRRQGRLLRHKGAVGRLPEGAGGEPCADDGSAAAGLYRRARQRPGRMRRTSGRTQDTWWGYGPRARQRRTLRLGLSRAFGGRRSRNWRATHP
jgi:hypothetical protein